MAVPEENRAGKEPTGGSDVPPGSELRGGGNIGKETHIQQLIRASTDQNGQELSGFVSNITGLVREKSENRVKKG